MNCNQYVTNRIKGKHLTSVERDKFETTDIIGVFKRTIIREKKRGDFLTILSIQNEYSSKKAHN